MRLYIFLAVLAGCVAVGILFMGLRSGAALTKSVTNVSYELISPDARARDQATTHLRELGSTAVPPLIDLLSTKDSLVTEAYSYTARCLTPPLRLKLYQFLEPTHAAATRAVAARALGTIGPGAREAIPALARALRDKDKLVAWEAATALGRVGKESVPTLVSTLRDEDLTARHAAVYALGLIRLEAKAAIPALIATLKDTNTNVRASAAQTLGLIGEPAVPGLIESVRQPDKSVRELAAKALGLIGTSAEDALPALMDLLSDNDDAVRTAAADALEKIAPGVAQVAPPK